MSVYHCQHCDQDIDTDFNVDHPWECRWQELHENAQVVSKLSPEIYTFIFGTEEAAKTSLRRAYEAFDPSYPSPTTKKP